MHAVIRKYSGSPGVIEEARSKLGNLELTMRGVPGFVAYDFLETAGGVTTITIADDEAGAAESMVRAAQWVKDNLQNASQLGAPEVITGRTLPSINR